MGTDFEEKRKSKGLPRRIKDVAISILVQKSENLWQAVFDECDNDQSGTINRRELLVLMKRLNLEIPSEDELTVLIEESDINEDGELDFREFTDLIGKLGIERTVDVVATSDMGFREAVRSYLDERRNVVLWRDLFNRLDGWPRDGSLDAYELAQAFQELEGPAMGVDKIRKLLLKYDEDGDGKISFEEFKAKATDVISSGIRYDLANMRTSSKLGPQGTTDRLKAAERQATLANAQNPPLNASALPEVEARLSAAFQQSGTFDEAIGVLRVQDDLYRKFKIKYASMLKAKYGQDLDDTLTAERVLLLEAIVNGDLDAIRASTSIDWNFVYPPAYVDPDSGERQLEAWCRTPLCLLVRPDEGNFNSKLRGVSEKERQALLQDVLSSGCADPNFPLIYWSNPAVHACFEGDTAALETLRSNGANLKQKFEWVLQDEPLFSLVHAAAFNGQEKVLRYLRTLNPPSFFRELDATGSNALHVVLESSRDMETAKFLLEQDVDAFLFNYANRSPLSMSIEYLPELAQDLLEKKSRFEYRWWGNDLFWFSFAGIILPLQNRRPVTVNDQNGDPTTIEQLIVRHKRKKLLETPLMLDVVERKWSYFAAELYAKNLLKFSAMLVSVFVASVVPQDEVEFYVATGAVAVTWALNLEVQLSKLLITRKTEGAVTKEALTFVNVLDTFHLVAVPVLAALRLSESLSFISMATELGSVIAFGTGILQVTLALRMLTYVSLFQVLGPLLVTVLSMLIDAGRFSSVLIIVILGYANGFYSLIHSSTPPAQLAEMAEQFDYSYPGILSEMLLWLTGQANFDLIRPLGENVQVAADVLFWTYIATAYFLLLNLLIAIFNSTYDRVISNSVSEWLFVRLNTLLDFETNEPDHPGVRAYYEQLQSRDGQRAIVSDNRSGPDQP